MRVLHVHSGNLYGGVETVLRTLARCRHLAPSMDMSVALCFEGQIAAELRAAGIEPFLLGDARLRRPDRIWLARRALRRLLERGDFDAVVCHQAWPLALFGPVVRKTHARLVLWLHMAHRRHWLNRLAWRVRPDMVICNSRFTASTVPQDGVRVEVVYYPVEAPETARRSDVSISPDTSDAIIIQVSRMEAWKGQVVCLEALAQLPDGMPWACWQVGGAQRPEEERYLASLHALAKRLGIAQRVRFMGQRNDVHNLLAQAQIYCQPNIEPEPFGIGLIEALGSGLPVITSSIGGAVEIVDDSCGVLVSPRDSASLAREIARLIDDRDRRERLGAAGPARARALCEPSVQMPRLAKILDSVHSAVRH
ncbi:MAG TPA: glycosyltransferase family 4 protein [Vicinamibacterales bacterium]|nr:glycosyltransferase family 4 protein [Vicinamibacterales bacterium]